MATPPQSGALVGNASATRPRPQQLAGRPRQGRALASQAARGELVPLVWSKSTSPSRAMVREPPVSPAPEEPGPHVDQPPPRRGPGHEKCAAGASPSTARSISESGRASSRTSEPNKITFWAPNSLANSSTTDGIVTLDVAGAPSSSAAFSANRRVKIATASFGLTRAW